MASLPAERREQIEAHKQECLERYRQALELACSIHAQRRDKGNGWRMWAERELAAHPELEREARAKLNRLMKGQTSDRA
ncbi:hypothetical protein [Azotobacter vinelandii]|uniref:hypothetical protein n=1 Tax=Azotobacter vinelandii TaxID=354 RepID=UPI0026658A01|nr:hypothetical protein [Azotobacter vinelandii]WKN20833.1 hypothetical protein AVAEIV_003859 [Azotobacter vinelandii]